MAAEAATEMHGTRTVQCQNSWGGVKPLFDVVSAGGLRNADDPRVPYLQHVLITDVRITRMRRATGGNRAVLPLPLPVERHAGARPPPLLPHAEKPISMRALKATLDKSTRTSNNLRRHPLRTPPMSL